MEKEFWKKAWVDRKIGFHQAKYSPPMLGHYQEKDLENKNVLIPLAGKSKDILYFLERGANVTAIELSELAVKEFFEENSFDDLEVDMSTDHTVYRTKNLKFYCGDFFKFSKSQASSYDYYYDRACIVALPLDLRLKYYKHIGELLNKHTDIFILTLTHDGPKDFGPPFYVPETEIEEAYKSIGFDLVYNNLMEAKAEGRFKEAGITKMKRLSWKRSI